MSTKSRVALLTTGGTIAGLESVSGIKPECSSKDLINTLIEKKCLPNNILPLCKDVMCLLSEDMYPQLWKELAEKVAQTANEGVDGIVITHGTYTMSYTAAALSFMLKNLNIPVVMTGSQKLLNDKFSDGIGNLSSSFKIASEKITPSKVLLLFSASPEEVSNYFNNLKIEDPQKMKLRIPNESQALQKNGYGHFIFSGCRIKKYHSRREDAFHTNSNSVVGYIKDNEIVFPYCSGNREKKQIETSADTQIETKVALIKSYPGIDPEIIDIYINRGYKGIIIEGYGDGIVSTKGQYSFINPIKRATERGIGVFMTSQTIGAATLEEYIGGTLLREAGAVPLGDMTTECAMVKLMWILGHYHDLSDIHTFMRKDLCGEITDKSWVLNQNRG